MIKVLYIIGQLSPDGTEWQLVHLLRGIDKTVFQCYVCSLWPMLDLAPEVREAGAVLVPIYKRFRFDLTVPFRLARFIRREKIDIVHCLLPTANVWGRIGGILAGAKIVISERNIETWKPWYWLCVDRMLAGFTGIVLTNAEAIKRFVVESAHIDPRRVRVIYNAVNPDRFLSPDTTPLRDALNIPSNARVLTSIGRLHEQKDMATFLRACAIVRSRVGSMPVRILIVGSGPQRGELEALVKVLGLENETNILSWRRDIETILTLTDIFVLTSIREGLPNVVLEAMAAGKPVVASDVGGTPEAVVHGVTGMIVPPGDAHRFADAICRLLDDPAEAAALGRRGRARVIETFTQARMVTETQQIYSDLQSGLSIG